MGAADATFKIRIVDCKLHVRKVRLSPSVFVARAKAFEKGNAKYPIKRTVCKTFTISAGNLDASQKSLFSGQLPTRIGIGCVPNRGFNGAYNLNPFNFEHFNLTQVKIYFDGQQHSIRPLETDFASHLYITAYTSLFAGTGKLYKDEGMDWLGKISKVDMFSMLSIRYRIWPTVDISIFSNRVTLNSTSNSELHLNQPSML